VSYDVMTVPEAPNWDPLERLLPREECELFMYVGRHGGIELYKHYYTRRYLISPRPPTAFTSTSMAHTSRFHKKRRSPTCAAREHHYVKGRQ
jgi:hypothetical protein